MGWGGAADKRVVSNGCAQGVVSGRSIRYAREAGGINTRLRVMEVLHGHGLGRLLGWCGHVKGER